jgi:hypothetical protein
MNAGSSGRQAGRRMEKSLTDNQRVPKSNQRQRIDRDNNTKRSIPAIEAIDVEGVKNNARAKKSIDIT